ncbi:hypothetical protein BH10PLA2_BH10PLA2_32920 [soil metagenome]
MESRHRIIMKENPLLRFDSGEPLLQSAGVNRSEQNDAQPKAARFQLKEFASASFIDSECPKVWRTNMIRGQEVGQLIKEYEPLSTKPDRPLNDYPTSFFHPIG